MVTDLTRERLAALTALVRSPAMAGRWLVLTHDNPDPDSITAAALLAKLIRTVFKRRVTTGYGGLIGRAENQEMVKVLGIRISHTRYLNWKHYRHFALVDTQPGTGNNSLPDEIVPDVVFDHHPARRATSAAAFSDIRTDYGATASILAEYLEAAEIELSKPEATALVYAIRSETQDFGREFSSRDKAIFDALMPRADARALARIQTPRLPLSYFKTLHTALENLEGVSTLVVSHLGPVEQPDIVPEVADLMLRLRGKTWSLATGIFGDRVYLSLRTTNPRGDSGRVMRRLLGRRGKGGGHGMMAGGWIDLVSEKNGDAAALARRLAQKLARALKKNPDRLAPIPLADRKPEPPETPPAAG